MIWFDFVWLCLKWLCNQVLFSESGNGASQGRNIFSRLSQDPNPIRMKQVQLKISKNIFEVRLHKILLHFLTWLRSRVVDDVVGEYRLKVQKYILYKHIITHLKAVSNTCRSVSLQLSKTKTPPAKCTHWTAPTRKGGKWTLCTEPRWNIWARWETAHQNTAKPNVHSLAPKRF